MNQLALPRDPVHAKVWLERAAELGHPDAMLRLGYLELRTDAPDKEVRAIAWFHRAAARGNVSAMKSLGFSYRDGSGAAIDLHEAQRWFLRAIEAGDKPSLMYIGRLHAYHLNSPETAIPWFEQVASSGGSDGAFELALLFGDRKSGVFDPAKAVRWYKAVANKSRFSAPRALVALARFTRDGQGTEQNAELAKSYLEIALQIMHPKNPLRKEAQTLYDDIATSLI